MEQSSLRKLPPEIRNCIYELISYWPEPLTLKWERKQRQLYQANAALDAPRCPPAFTQTCRQIREESLKLFYSINNIELHFTGHEVPDYRMTLSIFVGRLQAAASEERLLLTINLGQLTPLCYNGLQLAITRLLGPDPKRPLVPLTIRATCIYGNEESASGRLVVVLQSSDFKTSRRAAVEEVERLRCTAVVWHERGALQQLKKRLLALGVMAEIAEELSAAELHEIEMGEPSAPVFDLILARLVELWNAW